MRKYLLLPSLVDVSSSSVHVFNIGRAWRCTAPGTEILQITHLIPFAFVFLHRLYSLVRRTVNSKRNNEKEMKIAVMKKDLEIEACDVTDIDAFVAEKGKATGPDILLHKADAYTTGVRYEIG